MLVLLVAIFVYFSVTQDNFLTRPNIENLLTSVSILFIVSIGMTFVVLTGGIDLSRRVAARALRASSSRSCSTASAFPRGSQSS